MRPSASITPESHLFFAVLGKGRDNGVLRFMVIENRVLNRNGRISKFNTLLHVSPPEVIVDLFNGGDARVRVIVFTEHRLQVTKLFKTVFNLNLVLVNQSANSKDAPMDSLFN